MIADQDFDEMMAAMKREIKSLSPDGLVAAMAQTIHIAKDKPELKTAMLRLLAVEIILKLGMP